MRAFLQRQKVALRPLIGLAYSQARSRLSRARSYASGVMKALKGTNRHMIDPATDKLLNLGLATAVPPEDLIFLVNGHRVAAQFAASRVAAIKNIAELLAQAGEDIRRFRSILDFGCGCGRILAGWEHLLQQGTKLRGFDINSDLIEFCRKNISFAETVTSNYYPPLPIEDSSVDFAYAASIWTHLSLPASMQWAGEFARIIRPGGIALVSYHGSYFAPTVAKLSTEGLRQLEERGFYMHLHVRAAKTFEGSNEYATFMTTAFFKSLFVGFDLVRLYPGVAFGPQPFASYQDIAVLRRY